MEAVEELVDVISMQDFLTREAKNLGKLPPANLLEKPADLWNFFEVGVKGTIKNTANREVFPLQPPGGTLLCDRGLEIGDSSCCNRQKMLCDR